MARQEGGGFPCLDENAVLDFVQGRLGEDEVVAIDEHVDGCLSCRQAIDEAVRAFGQRSTHFEAASGPVAVVTRFSAGDTLAGRYRIIRFIARGGMGEVYEAEDGILGTRLAVKTVAATISDNPRAARRLKQEVNLARRITHPNVCRIFDLGVHGGAERTGGGVLFITMELVAGISLAHRLREEGAFSPAAALPIARAMASAIGAAHRAGVIHRDFKTDNVMLASGGPDGVRVVVMDFGLARGTAPSTHDSMENRGLAGTLAYMAPEQLDGQKTSQAADLYALGVVMYEMLTGHLPFPPEPGEPPLAAVLNRLTETAPPLRSVLPKIDARWNDVVAHCLERQPERRPASADDVARVLAEAESVEAAPSGRIAADLAAARIAATGGSRPGWRRVGILAIVSGGLAAAAVGVALQHRPAARATESITPGHASSGPSLVHAPAEATAPPSRPGPQLATAPPVEVRAGDGGEAAAAEEPRPARRPTAARSPRRAPNVPATPEPRAAPPPLTGPTESAAPKPHRSTDPDDGFIFQ